VKLLSSLVVVSSMAVAAWFSDYAAKTRVKVN
jgi:hypothetical protein